MVLFFKWLNIFFDVYFFNTCCISHLILNLDQMIHMTRVRCTPYHLQHLKFTVCWNMISDIKNNLKIWLSRIRLGFNDLMCYLSTIPTYNSHFISHLNSHFLLSRSRNSFLKNSHFLKKNSHFYLIRSGNLSGN